MTLDEISHQMTAVIADSRARAKITEKAAAEHTECAQKHAAGMREIRECIEWMRGRSL